MTPAARLQAGWMRFGLGPARQREAPLRENPDILGHCAPRIGQLCREPELY